MKLLLPVILSFALLAWSGCTSTTAQNRKAARTLDWNQRIGNYTLAQAEAELGKPYALGESQAGRTAEWILKQSPGMSFGVGLGGGSFGRGSGVGMGVGTEISPPPRAEALRLTFGPDGNLKEWMRLRY